MLKIALFLCCLFFVSAENESISDSTESAKPANAFWHPNVYPYSEIGMPPSGSMKTPKYLDPILEGALLRSEMNKFDRTRRTEMIEDSIRTVREKFEAGMLRADSITQKLAVAYDRHMAKIRSQMDNITAQSVSGFSGQIGECIGNLHRDINASRTLIEKQIDNCASREAFRAHIYRTKLENELQEAVAILNAFKVEFNGCSSVNGDEINKVEQCEFAILAKAFNFYMWLDKSFTRSMTDLGNIDNSIPSSFDSNPCAVAHNLNTFGSSLIPMVATAGTCIIGSVQRS